MHDLNNFLKKIKDLLKISIITEFCFKLMKISINIFIYL